MSKGGAVRPRPFCLSETLETPPRYDIARKQTIGGSVLAIKSD